MIQTYIILGIAVITTATAQLFFKYGMNIVGDISFTIRNSLNLMLAVFKNPYLLSGLFFYMVSFLLWLFVIAKMNISTVYPMTALNFVVVIIAAFLIFKESLTIPQMLGILLIVGGVLLLGGGMR